MGGNKRAQPKARAGDKVGKTDSAKKAKVSVAGGRQKTPFGIKGGGDGMTAKQLKDLKKLKMNKKKKFPVTSDSTIAEEHAMSGDNDDKLQPKVVGGGLAQFLQAVVAVQPTVAAATTAGTSTKSLSDKKKKEHVNPYAAKVVQDHRFAFNTVQADHAETPLISYQHIEEALTRLAKKLGKTKANLIIYDPYFCQGSVVGALNKLGFLSVINRNEDFYKQIALNTIPVHDVLVTNPPFSGIHLQLIFEFCSTKNLMPTSSPSSPAVRPFFLLQPQYVSKKPFFLERLKQDKLSSPTLLPPISPIVYLGPSNRPYSFISHALVDQTVGKSSSITKGVEIVGAYDANASRVAKRQGKGGGFRQGTSSSNAFAALLDDDDDEDEDMCSNKKRKLEQVDEEDEEEEEENNVIIAGRYQCVWFCGAMPKGVFDDEHLEPLSTANASSSAAGFVASYSVRNLPLLAIAQKSSALDRRQKKKINKALK